MDPIKFPEKNGFQGPVSNRLLVAEFYPQFTLVNLWESTTEIITGHSRGGVETLGFPTEASLRLWFGHLVLFFSFRF